MKRFIKHSLLLLASITFVLLWQNKYVSIYTNALVGLLTLFYIIFIFSKKFKLGVSNINIATCLLLTTTILLLVFFTGQLNSYLFFLLYFLLFYISFTLLPESVFVFSLTLLIIFAPHLIKNGIYTDGTQLASLLLLTPLAYFFGKEIQAHEKNEKRRQQITNIAMDATRHISDDVGQILHMQESTLLPIDLKRLKDIKNQADILKNDLSS